MTFKRLTDFNLAGKRVFIRADLNVPVKDGKVTSDARITASMPTIEHCLKAGAKVMVTSHLGRPEGVFTEENSCARRRRVREARQAGGVIATERRLRVPPARWCSRTAAQFWREGRRPGAGRTHRALHRRLVDDASAPPPQRNASHALALARRWPAPGR
jgi:hypothetical protein